MRAVFDTRPTSIYDDAVSECYHFPRRYLSILDICVGDWVVLRRPRADGGNLAYFAVAKVTSVDPDPQAERMSYARFSDYLDFDQPVPWISENRYAEKALLELPKQEVGIYLRGRSVRLLTDEDFVDLIRKGLQQSLDAPMCLRLGLRWDELRQKSDSCGPNGKVGHVTKEQMRR